MKVDPLPTELTKLVTPRALKNYATALGWRPVPGVNGSIAVFHQPKSDLHQAIVPLDESYDDYGDTVAEAVRKLASFEKLRASEVLNHLLLPPSDILRFSESSPDSETGTLPLEHAMSVIEGARKSLLSVAHSVLRPQAYHPRLSRGEAEQFVQSCRLGQTERGSFVVTIACPIDVAPTLLPDDSPFARQVTHGFISLLDSLSLAAEASNVDELMELAKYPVLSANLCDALLMLRPAGDRSKLNIGVVWSKAIQSPEGEPKKTIEFGRETFESLEYLIPRLRAAPQAKHETFVGYVDVLRGQPDANGQMSGEVVFSIVLDSGESLRARADLSAKDYKEAGDAHLFNDPVYFRGTLLRAARLNRSDQITDLRRLGLNNDDIPAPAGG